MTAAIIPTSKKRVPLAIMILGAFVVLGVVSMMVRWFGGLGTATNLSDTRPWGLWISFDVFVMALSGAAFTMAAVVNIFHLEKYRFMMRIALLGGLVGYLVAAAALTVELGRPERVWHFLVYWNVHSPLFEVGMCVMSYLAILTIEFIPLLLQKYNLKKMHQIIHVIEIPIVIAGITLSTGHQSSLGSLYLILPGKLHTLWHTPALPVIFFLSAVTAGVGMVILQGMVGNRIFGWNIKKDIFLGMAKGLTLALSLLLVVKAGDLFLSGDWRLIFEGSNQSRMFIMENVFGYAMPLAILLVPKFRKSLPWVFRASVMSVIGLLLHRFNVSYTGLAGAPYTPHFWEIASTLGLLATSQILYWLAVTKLPIAVNPDLHAVTA